MEELFEHLQMIGNTASGLWTSTDSEPLTPALIDELLAGNIYINLHTAANPGGEIRGQVNVKAVAIPVELTSFTADVSNGAVVLNWKTASETNNSGFEIQRRTEKGQWKELGFVTGSGTTSEIRSYSFTDNTVNNGFYSYRLKQIDYDGSFEYSDVVDVELFSPIEFALYQNFPNPFNPVTIITYHIPELSNVTLEVYDVIGNEIATLVNEEKQAGIYTVEFDATEFSSGIYLYGLQANNFIATKKLLLLK